MKKKKTQLLGIVLSAAMLATSVPAPVYAEPTDNVAEEVPQLFRKQQMKLML